MSLLRFIQSLNCNPQSKTEKELDNVQTLHLHAWWQSGLQVSNSFFIFVDCNKLFSHGLVLLPVKSFPQQIADSSGSQSSWGFQVTFNVTPSCSNVWDSHIIFRAPPTGWCHFSISALCSTLSSGWSTPLLLLFSVIIPWYWHFQYTGVFHRN